ncbi:unnamed protein product [Dracunculus medinensis]|uniref:Reverse transcriptase domain-containing protein n=1 Tax=Dracunculus medinensis TaxID=318479 RepID=A0A0N4UP78_DRAME|nr:unnamed protein product [Dracunculus medinensis]
MCPNKTGPGSSCVDQIFMPRRVLEHHLNINNLSTVTCFSDFTAAFDSIDKVVLWTMMECDGVSEKIVRLIKAFFQLILAYLCIWGATRLFRNKNWYSTMTDWKMDIVCRYSTGMQISPEYHRAP